MSSSTESSPRDEKKHLNGTSQTSNGHSTLQNGSKAKETPKSGDKNPGMNEFESLWKYLSVIVVILSLTVTYTLKGFNDWAQENLVEYARFSDFQYAVYFACLLFIVRRVFEFFFFQPVKNNLLPQYQGADRDARAQKVIKWIYSIVYYSFTTAFVYYFYIDTEVFDPLIGGKGSVENMFNHMPNTPSEKEYPYMKYYYLFQLGSHVATLFEQIFMRRDELKYYENFLHHFLAVMLIVNSYLQHEWIAGLYILLTHDCTDIVLALSRSVEAFYKPKGMNFKSILVYILFIVTITTWIYFRNVIYFMSTILQSYKIQGSWGVVWPMVSTGFWYSFFMTCILMIMDLFWSYILLSITVSTIYKKNMKNFYDPTVNKAKIN